MEIQRVPFYPLTRGVSAIRIELDLAISEVLDSANFISGHAVTNFESKFADFSQASYCVGAGNGLDALEMALAACQIGIGDEVIVPGFTFAATILAVVRRGATPVVVDIDPSTANICCEAVTKAITQRTRAVIAVHLHGFQAPMRELRRISDDHGLFLIEDAAQAHGSLHEGTKVGHWSHIAAYSFYPSKNLGALGDAGCITTNTFELSARARAFGNYGNVTNKYSHEVLGFNTRLDTIQAAALSVGLSQLEESNSCRQRIARRYLEGFGELKSLRMIPQHFESSGGVWHHFIVRSNDRTRCREFLHSRGIMTETHYPVAAYRLPALTKVPGYQPPLILPHADALAEETISLPMHPWLHAWEVDQVIASVLEWEAATQESEWPSHE